MPARKDGLTRHEETRPIPMDSWIGSRVRWLRTQRGMRVHELASAIGMTRQAIEKYERGGQRIPASKLYEIGTILETHPGWFYEDCPSIGIPTGKPDTAPEALSSAGIAMVTRFERLNPEQRRAVTMMVGAFDDLNAAGSAGK